MELGVFRFVPSLKDLSRCKRVGRGGAARAEGCVKTFEMKERETIMGITGAPRGLLAKAVAALAIAVFWCISAVGTTVGITTGVASLAAAVTAATSTTAEAGRRRRRRRRRRRNNVWEWYWWQGFDDDNGGRRGRGRGRGNNDDD